MPRFTILPTDHTHPSTEVAALDSSSVLNLVERMSCGEADVLTNGAYSFSVRLNESGVWIIFDRDWKGRRRKHPLPRMDSIARA